MPLPWLQILDAVIGVTDIVRSRKIKALAQTPRDEQQQLEAAGRGGPLEARLAGVVVAALKEAFDRDARRIEFEREQAAVERERAERALRLELQRQAGDREIGRLRLVAGLAAATWIGTLFFSARLLAGGAGARALVAVGWLLLIAAIASAFTAQSNVAAALDALGREGAAGRPVSSGAAGAVAIWLIVAGLALVAVAAIVAAPA